VYQEDVLQGVVKPINTTLFNCQELVFQQNSATARSQDVWGVAAEDPPDLHQSIELALRMPYVTPWTVNGGLHVLNDMACQKNHSNLERSPWRQCVWQQQIG